MSKVILVVASVLFLSACANNVDDGGQETGLGAIIALGVGCFASGVCS